MTSQGSAHGRFTRALAQRNLRGAEIAAGEMGGLSLLVALDYLVLRFERHGGSESSQASGRGAPTATTVDLYPRTPS